MLTRGNDPPEPPAALTRGNDPPQPPAPAIAGSAGTRLRRAPPHQPMKPPRQPADRIWLTCWAAELSAACGWLLPSSTDTIMLPRTVEIFG